MILKQKLELRQGQSLVMTPQLQQAIRLLQMSSYELAAYVETELERNPFLERDESTSDASGPENLELESGGAGTGEEGGDEDGFDGQVAADFGRAATLSAGIHLGDENGSASEAGWAGARARGVDFSEPGRDRLEMVASRERTLQEHLTEQLNVTVGDPAQRLIGHHLIGMLDDAGYLTTDPQAVAETLGTSIEAVNETLATLQEFDPPGVFARDLRECLALQLKERGRYNAPMAALLDNLPLLAKHDMAALKRLCRVDMASLKAMTMEIRQLSPKPGNAFGSFIIQPIIPDVFVRPAPDGGWIVELNTETLPKVLINNQYYARVTNDACREEDRIYLSECHASATWLTRSLEQRARTILKVAREIVRQQDAFLVHGVQCLRPLNLRMVADAIEMHESTVSRVTTNKHISTPRGIFEMKYFFTTAIASSEGGDSYSAEAVRHRIRSLIDNETAENVLSDDQIVELLCASGVDIARRTVAKYRESLGIGSSVQRRREKRTRG